ncbi:hypothetical protein [Streptomyces sp. NPDC101166]|uniref:hypothetical protein n=1 Tax=Streptomyces sp. NPDC101166 TaxID=3366120 RepID=UPI003811843F
MNLPAQVDTVELSDSDLDGLAGAGADAGFTAVGSGGLQLETPLVGVCADVLSVASAEGLGLGTATAVHTTAA